MLWEGPGGLFCASVNGGKVRVKIVSVCILPDKRYME